MNYAQVIFKVLEEERGYKVKHYVLLGYDRNTIINWINGHTSPPVARIEQLLKDINYSPITMLKKVARYEYNRSREQA